VSNLPGALGGQTTGWSRHFFDPIPAGDGGELRTLRDAGVYILALPPAEAEREHLQVAMECLISAAEKGGIVMMARIAMLRALNHGEPDPVPAPQARQALQDRQMTVGSRRIACGSRAPHRPSRPELVAVKFENLPLPIIQIRFRRRGRLESDAIVHAGAILFGHDGHQHLCKFIVPFRRR
jgi:hypothetical protein